MRYNRKRHKTLGLLSTKRIKFDTGQHSYEPLGVSFDDLERELNCDKDATGLIFAPLYHHGEVEYTNVGLEGLFLTQKGLTVYSENKYLKQNDELIISWLTNFVKIAVPILSLIVAIIALSIKFNNVSSEITKEIKTINNKAETLQSSINKLETRTKNIQAEILNISKVGNDSTKN